MRRRGALSPRRAASSHLLVWHGRHRLGACLCSHALMLRPAQPLHARAAPPHSDMVRACGGRQETVCSLRFAAKVNSCETAARGGARRNVQGAPDADAAAVRAAPAPAAWAALGQGCSSMRILAMRSLAFAQSGIDRIGGMHQERTGDSHPVLMHGAAPRAGGAAAEPSTRRGRGAGGQAQSGRAACRARARGAAAPALTRSGSSAEGRVSVECVRACVRAHALGASARLCVRACACMCRLLYNLR